MTPVQRSISGAVLGCAVLLISSAVLAQAVDECRGGYNVPLMTPAECQAYLRQLEAVQASGDQLAELDLREWHTRLLIERAEACPCRAGEHYALYQRTSSLPAARKLHRY